MNSSVLQPEEERHQHIPPSANMLRPILFYVSVTTKGSPQARGEAATTASVAGGKESGAWRHIGHRRALLRMLAASHVFASQRRRVHVSLPTAPLCPTRSPSAMWYRWMTLACDSLRADET